MDKDISTLLQEIKAATSWSEPRIADELGTSQPTVNRILNGQEDCKGSTFKAIQDLHKKVCISVAEQKKGQPADTEHDRRATDAR
jgi:transcriptional regulator with XRE-family HTH domain